MYDMQENIDIYKIKELPEAGQCKWPIGDPKDDDYHVCTNKQVEGKIYCPKHYAEAFKLPKKVKKAFQEMECETI